MLLALVTMSVAINAQTVTKTFKDTPLKAVLEEVEAQTGYSFMYRNEDIKQNRPVTATFKDASVASVLDKVLGNGYSYAFKDKIISITKATATAPAAGQTTDQPGQDETTMSVPVKGKVVDAKGLPVTGAVLTVPGHNELGGVITDYEGNFSWKVPQGSEVLVSCIGYQAVNKTADGSGTGWNIVLGEDSEMLEETIVVGYGVQKKESVVGSITQIDNAAIVNTGLTNVTQAIAGKLSGVLTLQSSGQPGSNDAAIYIRGVSSWNGDTPLVMVDGVERDMNSIDPNEIASISVLKDASATAVYGAKGANGVILVTTRKGEKGKPKMNLTVTHGFLIPSRLPEHQDSYTTASGLNVAFKNQQDWGHLFSDRDLQEYRNPSSKINSIRYPDNDWYDIMLKDVAHNTDANLNVSGGSDRTRYFVSLGYKHEGSIFETFQFDDTKYEYNRLNYRANLDFNLTRSTTLSYRVGGSIGIKQSPDSSPIKGLFGGNTISFPAYYPSWVLEMIPDQDYPDASGDRFVAIGQIPEGHYYGSPYNAINIPSYNQTTTSKLYTDVILDQKLDFITQGLSIQGKFSFSTTMARASESVSATIPTFYLNWDYYELGQVNPWLSGSTSTSVVEGAPYSESQGGMSSHSYNLYWEGSMNYNRSFNNHHITALALFNQRENCSSFDYPYRSMGLVGRFTYAYKHKYLLEGNVGYTGSEQFAPANRFGLFPSVALGYVISQEKWWKNAMPWWSKMKLRYSDGTVGSDTALGNNRWLFFSSFAKDGDLVYEESSANTTARWETARKRDIGIEMGWLDNKLTAEVDLFDELRSDMLVAPVETYIVGTKSKMVNKGELKKHGIEFELEWQDKLDNGLKYYVKAMYSFNENRIVNYEDPPYLPKYQKTAGKPHKGMTLGTELIDEGYYINIDEIHKYPSYTTDWTYLPVGAYKYSDYCPDGIITKDDLHSITGSKYPCSLGSFGFGFNWKGWDFSALFYGNFGKYANFNGSYELDFCKGDIHLSQSMADYWSPSNTGANHSTLVYNGSSGHAMYSWGGVSGGSTSNMGIPGRTWRQVDYVNLRDLYLGYTFNSKTVRSKFGVSSLTLYLTGNNLFYFTNLLEGNPELTEFVEGAYPLMRTVQLGVKLGF